MSYIKIPKYKQIEFIIRLHFLTKIKKKDRGMVFHILGYKEDETSKKIDAVCLEFGIFAEGETPDKIAEKFINIAEDMFQSHDEKEIIKLLKNPHMDKFWALYRERAYKTAPETIKRDYLQMKNSSNMWQKLKQYEEKIEEQKKQIEKLENNEVESKSLNNMIINNADWSQKDSYDKYAVSS